MAGASDLNSCGTKFAEQQLLRHGWKQGKGLGRNENGISEAIRVKVKCDKGGIGHKESEQFTFHWWDHVFNKASAGLVVESAQNGVMVKKVDEGEEGVISNKKPRKALLDKSALYGNFVKSATLLSGQERPEQSSSSSDDSSSDDDEKLDLSSTKKLSDAELMKVCGGRTAHKGARHGLTMSAKLARLEQQEQEFMEKYGKKSQRDKTTSPSEAVPTEPCPASDQEAVRKTKKKKAKKEKRKQHADELQENGVQNDVINPEALQNHSDKETSKKKKKCLKDRAESEACVDAFEDVSEAECFIPKKKKKQQKCLDQVAAAAAEGSEVDGCCPKHEPDSENISKKERKKAKKRSKDVSLEAQLSEDCPETTENNDSVSKRKKKKSSKHKEDQSPNTEMNVLEASEETQVTASTEIEKSKSKKKKKSSREEQVEETEQSTESIQKKKKKKHEK